MQTTTTGATMQQEHREDMIHANRLIEEMLPYVQVTGSITAREVIAIAIAREEFDNDGLPWVPWRMDTPSMEVFEKMAAEREMDRLADLHVWTWMTGVHGIGPLTRAEHDKAEAYARYCEETEREFAAQDRAGGRTICENCGERKAKHHVTQGFDPTVYYECEGCGHVAM